MPLFSISCSAVAAGSLALTCAAAPPYSSLSDGYMNHEALSSAVAALARDFPQSVRLKVIGSSHEDREIFALTLSSDPATHHHRPGLLITAGLDGRHWVGTETAVRVARNLLENHADLLGEMSVYVIPRVNPDGAELNLGPINYGHAGNLRPVDLDRDGEVNEDGPNDLLENGVITMIRRDTSQGPLTDPPTHVVDPAEPRLLKPADAAKGEKPVYALYTEGIDEDDDGRIAEDGPGYVDLDRNFMHLWPEHQEGAGPYQLSEPESHALAEFVLQHRNLYAAITYGRHDNMINVPDHRGRDITGRAPTGIEGGDRELYESLSTLFKETTGQSRAPREDIAGSFHAWLYAQRGLVSVATVVWGRPDVETKDEEERAEEEGEGESDAPNRPARDPVAGTWHGTIDLTPLTEMGMEMPMTEVSASFELERAEDNTITGVLRSDMGGAARISGRFDPESSTLEMTGEGGGPQVVVRAGVMGDMMEGTASAMGMNLNISATREAADAAEQPAPRAQRRGRAASGPSPADAEAAAWLEYSDSRGGIGFVEWTEFDHPQLGQVEIGGFVPGFEMNPPADELDGLAEKQTAFVSELINRRPQLSITGPDVSRLAPGLYNVRIAITNEGTLPTATAIGQRARPNLPVVLHLHTPLDQIVSGDRVNRAWNIAGSGGRTVFHWLLRVDDGEEIKIELVNHQLGDRMITFTADENTTVDITALDPDREEVGP